MKLSLKSALQLPAGCLLGLLFGTSNVGAVIPLNPDGTTDRTSDIETALATAKNTNDYVMLNAGTYYHSGVLTINGAELRGAGDSTILHATDPENAAVKLTGSGPKLKNIKVRTNYSGSIVADSDDRLQADVSCLVYVKDATNFRVENVTAQTGRGAGIMVNNSGGTSSSSKAYIQNCRVRDTLADGIHMTNGSKYIVVQSNNVTNTADDLIAIVSYKFQTDGSTPKNPVACRDIGINNNTLSANVWGRGITVNGGHHVSVTNNTVTNSFHSGLILVSEGHPYYAWPTTNITVTNNTFSGCNASNTGGQSGIMIKGRSGYVTSSIAISEADVLNAKRHGIFVGGNSSGITFSDCLVDGATSSGLEVQGGNNIEFKGGTHTSYTSFIKNTGGYGVYTDGACTGYLKIRNTRFEQINKTSGNAQFDVIHVSNRVNPGLTVTITGNHYTNPAAATVHHYIECLEDNIVEPISPVNTTTTSLGSVPEEFE